MIQRIQSIMLLLVAIGMGLMGAMPIWKKISTTSTDSVVLNAINLQHSQAGKLIAETNTLPILILVIIAAVVALFEIFQYKNRKLQMIIGALNTMVIAATIGTSFYYIFTKGVNIFEPTVTGSYQIGLFAGAFAMLCNMLANRFIRRDEMLVRSADRMR